MGLLIPIVKGAAIYTGVILVTGLWSTGDGYSWWLLPLGMVNHLVAEYAGFTRAAPVHEHPGILGGAISALVVLAVVGGLALDYASAAVLWLEGAWAFVETERKTRKTLAWAEARGIDLSQP